MKFNDFSQKEGNAMSRITSIYMYTVIILCSIVSMSSIQVIPIVRLFVLNIFARLKLFVKAMVSPRMHAHSNYCTDLTFNFKHNAELRYLFVC